MASIVYPFTLTANTPENVNQLNSNLNAITAQVNGNLDTTNIIDGGVGLNDLSTAAAQQGGFTNAANIGRGKSIIATTEARTNTAFATLTTPDQVAGIVLPTDGLIAVMYQAMWQESVVGVARAAIFLGATQTVMQTSNGRQTGVRAAMTSPSGIINIDTPLFTGGGGLMSITPGGAYGADVTTGQIVGYTTNAGTGIDNLALESGATNFTFTGSQATGGPCYIFAAAGTYTVSVQFRATSGTVTAKQRKLWVWTMGF